MGSGNGSGVDEGAKSFTMCGTTEYLSPEAVSGRGHDKSIDLWALGCLLYELLVGRTPFRARQSEETLKHIVDSKRHLKDNRFMNTGPRDAVDLIRKLLDPNPATRLGGGNKGWRTIAHHKFFKDKVDFDMMLARKCTAPFTPKVSDALDVSGFEDSAVDLKDETQGPRTKIPDYDGDQRAFRDFGSEFARDSAFSTIPAHASAR